MEDNETRGLLKGFQGIVAYEKGHGHGYQITDFMTVPKSPFLCTV